MSWELLNKEPVARQSSLDEPKLDECGCFKSHNILWNSGPHENFHTISIFFIALTRY
jgi:GR25 family glycosyltransferase involved in LPS biosynthesis